SPIQQAIVATVSDDETWKVWSVPNCDLLMSGEGHRDWVSGVAFHPHGTMLATSAGDNTVKIWDFLQAVWGVSFHHSGDFLASCSM
ncbi:unnamed protein product, partial [Ectocarpus sp. 8 AP-2014]